MKTFLIKALSGLLVASMIASATPAVFAVGDENTYGNGTEDITQSSDGSNAQMLDSARESDQALVELSNDLANGTYTYYPDANRDTITIKNKNMLLNYGLRGDSDTMYVKSLENTKGESYVTNSMDVFVKTQNGNTYYASESLHSASLNIYRYGYYYYENRIEGQVFTNGVNETNVYTVNHRKPSSNNHIQTVSGSDYSYTINGSDPWVSYGNLNLNANDYDYVAIELTADDINYDAQLFIQAGNKTEYTPEQSITFSPERDGEKHTYYVSLKSISGYSGTLKAIRFDINAANDSKVTIHSIRIFKAENSGLESDLTIQRSFLSYSDKLHHLTQFSTTKNFTGIESVGMETKIAADSVNKIVVKDAGGHKESLSDVEWTSAEYVGFDVSGAGIFGYILPCDNNSGSMVVTLENGYYTITQTLPVSQFTPSIQGTQNANDIFFGQRIYNDESHSFDSFIVAAECERHPLTASNINIDFKNSTNGQFLGYDALRGFYVLRIGGTGFSNAYYNFPNRHFNVKFTITGDEYDRQMYFLSRCTSTGGLESAALLNSENMLLPVPMEVSKNFAGDGENTIYNIDDAAYAETFFPMMVASGEIETYNVLNLYQNWGKYPLKQISSIQFHTPYYHLSTGVTETNCIVPYSFNGPGLPDHRPMSAYFWKNQPQHNSGGAHNFLRYTNSEGNYYTSQNTTAYIDSYGMTYSDITLGFETIDGKISANYTAIEMPQTDENRSFYELSYVFNEDVSFKDFRRDFIFYQVGDNDSKGSYKKVGYLDENNQSQIVDAIQTAGKEQAFTLGNNCPYFSFFMMPDYNKESTFSEGYTNLSVLFKDWKVILNGKEIDAKIYLINTNGFLRFSLDLGEVTFKAGDTITLNTIIMPWGSDQYEDGIIDLDAFPPNYEYDMVLEDGSLYMDKNVRDVRENTLLNPMTATAVEACEVMDSAFVPKVKTTNGRSTSFTVSGGSNNVSVRVYGFNKLTVPKIEQLVNGEWVEYEINSKNSPDKYGFAHYYDGYAVYYDEDGTYSYSFVTDMTNVESKTFRVSASTEFEGWPQDESEESQSDFNLYLNATDICLNSTSSSFYGNGTLSQDGSYTSLYGNGSSGEAYLNLFTNNENIVTGKYFVYKYRIPADNKTAINSIDIWVSTVNSGATATGYSNDCINVNGNALQSDGQWHVMVLDITKIKSGFKPEADGTFRAKYLRLDTWNTTIDTESYVDIAYIAMSDSLNEILLANSDVASVDLFTTTNEYNTVSTNVTIPENAPTFSVSSAKTIRNGTVTLTVSLSGNTGISYLVADLIYNKDALELIKIENGNVFANTHNIDRYNLIWSSQSNVSENGDVIKLTFRIKSNAPLGNYEVGFAVNDITNVSGSEIAFNCQSGEITVWEPGVLFGDVNGDTEVNVVDVVLLRKYFANFNYDTNTSTITVYEGADVNGDSKIDLRDIQLLRVYIASYDYDNGKSDVILGVSQ